MAIPPCSYSSRIASTVCLGPHLPAGFDHHSWFLATVLIRDPQNASPTSHLLQPGDSITSGSLLAPLNVDLKPCSKMPWASGEQHLFPKPTWGLFSSQPKRVAQAGRGEITTNCKFLKKFSHCPSCSFFACHVPTWSPPRSFLQCPGSTPEMRRVREARAPKQGAAPGLFDDAEGPSTQRKRGSSRRSTQ